MASDPVDTTSTIVASATLSFPPRSPVSPVAAAAAASFPDPSGAFDTRQFGNVPLPPGVSANTGNALPLPPPEIKQHDSGYRVATPLSDADRSSKYHSIHLPSGFEFYPFKSLSVSLITGYQQAKLTRAAREANLRYTVEAITSTLGDGINAMDLTVPDFFYVLYWLRLASYTKYDFTHRLYCTNPAHHAQVHAGELPKESLVTIHVVKHTNLDERELDLTALDAVRAEVVDSGFPYELHPTTMSDLVQYAELLPEPSDDRDAASQLAYESHLAELEFLGNIACQLRVPGQEVSVADRMHLVEALSADHVQVAQKYLEVVGNYGIKESVKLNCKGCNAEVDTELSISAATFL